MIESVVAHFKTLGVRHLYISNDIDGTDAQFAPATGIPEKDGLHPDFVKQLIERVHQEFEIFGGDLVEVAPPLSGLARDAVSTIHFSTRGTREGGRNDDCSFSCPDKVETDSHDITRIDASNERKENTNTVGKSAEADTPVAVPACVDFFALPIRFISSDLLDETSIAFATRVMLPPRSPRKVCPPSVVDFFSFRLMKYFHPLPSPLRIFLFFSTPLGD